MDSYGILETLAEVGITIAGFSSLATVIWHRGGKTMDLDVYRFEGMLVNSLLVVAFALLPHLLASLQLPDEMVWRLASLVLLIVMGGRGIIITVNTWRMKMRGLPVGRPFYVMTGVLIAVVLAQVINVLLDAGSYAGGLYLVGVLGALANACVLFFLVFGAMIETAKQED